MHISNLGALAFTAMSVACKIPKVDVHAHFVPDFYAAAVHDAGHNPGPDGMPGVPVSTLPSLSLYSITHLLTHLSILGMECRNAS